MSGSEAVATCHWSAGTPRWQDGCAESEFQVAAGSRARLALALAHAGPLVVPGREPVLLIVAAVAIRDATVAAYVTDTVS
jgi:hypothetical protein